MSGEPDLPFSHQDVFTFGIETPMTDILFSLHFTGFEFDWLVWIHNRLELGGR